MNGSIHTLFCELLDNWSSLLISFNIPDFSEEKILSSSFSNISSSLDEVVLVDLVDTGVPLPEGVFLLKYKGIQTLYTKIRE